MSINRKTFNTIFKHEYVMQMFSIIINNCLNEMVHIILMAPTSQSNVNERSL